MLNLSKKGKFQQRYPNSHRIVISGIVGCPFDGDSLDSLLLQTRTKVLNGDLEETFRRVSCFPRQNGGEDGVTGLPPEFYTLQILSP